MITNSKALRNNSILSDADEHLRVILKTEKEENSLTGLSENEKIEKIAFHFKNIMDTLGLDLNDDSLHDTPNRVAKMFVNEIFYGLDESKKPEIKLFQNKFRYDQMLVQKDIKVHSYCEHHFVPIIGKAHVAYFSNGYVIGLSKLNRIVDYYSRKPQVQERLTVEIAGELKRILKTEDIAIIIEAEHMCVKLRGIKDDNSSTSTSYFSGKFQEQNIKNDFLRQTGFYSL